MSSIPYLVIVLRWGGGHVLKVTTHIHVLHRAVSGARVGIDSHSLHLFYW